MSKLKFKVVYCSSEDSGFPADELNHHGPQTKGWQSIKFAEYPQEIGLQLDDFNSQISQLQILSHQSKIPSKIELFIGTGVNYQGANFKRLGFLSLDSNERSNYQARELKTVYLDTPGNFVRLLLHKHHPNTENLFSQVGLVAINLIGNELPPSLAGIPSGGVFAGALGGGRGVPTSALSVLSDLSLDMNLDPQTASKIRQLAETKARAVANEDYALAKQIKAVESELRQLGVKLAQIDAAKKQAVLSEDYDRAKELKDDGDALRLEIERKVGSLSIPGMPDNRQPASQIAKSMRSPGVEDMAPQVSARRGAIGIDDMVVGGGSGNGNGGMGGAGGPPGGPMGQESDSVQGGYRDPLDDGDERPIRPKQQLHYHDVDPSQNSAYGPSSGRDESPEESYPEGEHPLDGVDKYQELAIPEELSVKSREAAEQAGILSLIGEYRTRCLFSKIWNLREAAISKVHILLQLQYERDPGVSAAMAPLIAIIRMGLEDKMQHVYFNAIALLEGLLSVVSRARMKMTPALLEPVVSTLLEKSADANARVRDGAKKALDSMIDSTCVGPTMIANQALKPATSKQLTNWRALVSKIRVLLDLVLKFGVGGALGHSSDALMGFLKSIGAFEHGNGEVRDAAKDLTVAMQKIVGTPAIEPFIKDLRDKQIQDLYATFDKLTPGGSGPPIKKQQQQQQQSQSKSGNNGSSKEDKRHAQQSPGPKQKQQGSSSSSSSSQQQSRQQQQQTQQTQQQQTQHAEDEEEEDFTKCLFCGKVDPNWSEELLDLHFVNECPYLTACPGCAQFIEVAAIPGHLLEECEHKNDYELCEVTGLAIKKSDMSAWKKSPNCRQPPEDCLVCPLCMSSVEDSDEAWRQHLMQGCPKHR